MRRSRFKLFTLCLLVAAILGCAEYVWLYRPRHYRQLADEYFPYVSTHVADKVRWDGDEDEIIAIERIIAQVERGENLDSAITALQERLPSETCHEQLQWALAIALLKANRPSQAAALLDTLTLHPNPKIHHPSLSLRQEL